MTLSPCRFSHGERCVFVSARNHDKGTRETLVVTFIAYAGKDKDLAEVRMFEGTVAQRNGYVRLSDLEPLHGPIDAPEVGPTELSPDTIKIACEALRFFRERMPSRRSCAHERNRHRHLGRRVQWR